MKEKSYSLSVIIPVYNVEEYIEECLISIISQSYQEPFECILIDDCSVDSSISKIEAITNNYKGNIDFRIIQQPFNQGVSAARNLGISSAQGEYLYFVDSDDVVFADCLEAIMKAAKKNPDSQLISIGLKISSNSYPYTDYEKYPLPEVSNNPDWISTAMLSYAVNVAPWTKCVKRQFILDNNLFFRTGYIFEDDIWQFELAKKILNLSVCNKNLYYYRVREGSIMTSTKIGREQRIEKRIKAINLKISLIDSHYNKAQVKSVWNQLLNVYRACQTREEITLVRKTFDGLIEKAESLKPLIRLSCLFSPQIMNSRIFISIFARILRIRLNSISPVI